MKTAIAPEKEVKWQVKNLRSLFLLIPAVLFLSACQNHDSQARSDIFDVQRRNMVRFDLIAQGIKSQSVLEAINNVPRHLFLPRRYQKQAYEEGALPIGQFANTPSPFVVAKTIELLELTGNEKVLEIGTGLGYQSAILSELSSAVYTIEIVPKMAKKAKKVLELLNYKNVHLKIGDGYKGWPEHAPFDAILVMASAKMVPDPLPLQLVEGGRLVMPIGPPGNQKLALYRRKGNVLLEELVMPIKMKPMEGRARSAK